VGQRVRADVYAVDVDGHLQVEEAVGVAAFLDLVGGDQPWSQGCGEVFALGRSEVDGHLPSLQVPGRPVVHDDVARDVVACLRRGEVASGGADDRRDLQFEVQQLAA